MEARFKGRFKWFAGTVTARHRPLEYKGTSRRRMGWGWGRRRCPRRLRRLRGGAGAGGLAAGVEPLHVRRAVRGRRRREGRGAAARAASGGGRGGGARGGAARGGKIPGRQAGLSGVIIWSDGEKGQWEKTDDADDDDEEQQQPQEEEEEKEKKEEATRRWRPTAPTKLCMIEYDDGDEEASVPRHLVFARCVPPTARCRGAA